MAYLFDVNNALPQHGSIAMFRVKTLLKLAGWTVTKSSDGTTYNATGDQITHGESGAGGLDNNRAWFVIRQPGTNGREFCFQRDTSTAISGYYWRIKYSGGPGTGFVGGAPTATLVPTATDEQVVFGGGTDSSPSFTNFLFGGTTYTSRLNVIAGTAGEGYPFLLWSSEVSYVNNGANSAFGLDIMQPGTHDENDVDPAVVYFGASNSTGCLNTDLFGISNAKAWFNKDDALSATFQAIGVVNLATSTTVSAIHQLRSSQTPGKDTLNQVFWGRNMNQGHPGGMKGISTLFRMLGAPRGYGTIFSLSAANARDWVAVGGQAGSLLAVPWNGSKALITR